MTVKLLHSHFKKNIIAGVIQNARIDLEVLIVFLAKIEWNQTPHKPILLISMNVSTIFVIRMLLAKILPVHIIVNALLGFLVIFSYSMQK